MGAILDRAMEHDGLLIRETVLVFAGSSTPEVDEPDAPVGSVYFRSNGDRYTRTANTGSGVATDWVREDPDAVAGGGSLQGSWKFSTTITEANPGSGRLRYNNATPASVTKLFINDTTNAGFDISNIFNNILAVGDKFYMQQADTGANFLIVTIDTITDNTGWFTLDVTVNASGSLPQNNRDVGVVIFTAGGGGGTPGDQAAVQTRRTTAQTFTTAWVDVTLDATDFENDAAVIEHDAITDRITLKNAGPYLVFYRVDADPVNNASSDHSKVRARIRVNDTGADLPGSLCENDALQDTSLVGDATQGAVLTGSFIYDATANDFVTLQIQKTNTSGDLPVDAAAGRIVFGAIRMTGEKGDTGATGAPGGSAIEVEDEGSSLTTDVTKFNFAGAGVTVTEPVTDEVLVTIPGGGGGGSARYADFYETGTTAIGTSVTTVGINTTRVSVGSAFTLSADEVTVDETDTYAVHFGVSLDHVSNSDFGVDIWLEIDTVEVAGTRFRLFHDNTNDETSGHATAILDLTATEVVRIRGQVFAGSGTIDTQADGVRLTFHTFSGATGATGVAGPAGEVIPLFYADQLDDTNLSDWAVNATSEEIADSVNAALRVRRFDDTTEEGAGFSIAPPVGTESLKFTFQARAQTAPGAARTVGLKLYNRGIPNNAAVQAWSSGNVLADIDIPTNAFFQYDTETITLAALGVTAGEDTQFQLTRIDPAGGTELTGDWNLRALQVEFIV